MVNQHTKFEMSMITCNEDMKGKLGNAKYVKILVLGHPLGLSGNAQGSSSMA